LRARSLNARHALRDDARRAIDVDRRRKKVIEARVTLEIFFAFLWKVGKNALDERCASGMMVRKQELMRSETEFNGVFAKGNLKSIARLTDKLFEKGIRKKLRESRNDRTRVATSLQQVSEGTNRKIRTRTKTTGSNFGIHGRNRS